MGSFNAMLTARAESTRRGFLLLSTAISWSHAVLAVDSVGKIPQTPPTERKGQHTLRKEQYTFLSIEDVRMTHPKRVSGAGTSVQLWLVVEARTFSSPEAVASCHTQMHQADSQIEQHP